MAIHHPRLPYIVWVDRTGADFAVPPQRPLGVVEVVGVNDGLDGLLLAVAAVHQLRSHLPLLVALYEAQGEQAADLFSEALIETKSGPEITIFHHILLKI